MSTIKTKNIQQKVISGTTQPLKIGGILEDGSDAKITIDTNGNTTLSQVIGIKFPSTQNPSADANTLDDYEEGTFTPVPVPETGAITSYTDNGRYTKIGNVVTITFTCKINDIGTGAGDLKITGLPFASRLNFMGVFGTEPFGTGLPIVGYINGTEIPGITKLLNGASIIGTGMGPAMNFTYLTY